MTTWQKTRLKYVADANTAVLPEDTSGDYEFTYVDISNVTQGSMNLESPPIAFADAPSRARRLAEKGDSVVSTVRTYLRAVATVPDFDGHLVFSTGFAVLHPKPGLVPRFLSWYLQGDEFVSRIEANSTGVSYPAIAASQLMALDLQLPTPDEQRAIADYLDRETTRIDTLIEEQQRLIEMLQERRESVVDLALTHHGFKIPARFEDYAGSLPDGWRLILLGQTLQQLTNGFVGPTRDILVDDGIRYIQSTHIKSGRIDFDRRPFYVSREWHEERPRIHLRSGDVLIVQTGDIGKVAVVPPDFGESSCHALQIARVRPELLSGEYLGAFLSSRIGYQSLLARATGAMHPHLEAGIRGAPIVVPPLEVQGQVVEEVAIQTAKIDTLIAETETFIELARERRSALITAAVTGQIDVRGAA